LNVYRRPLIEANFVDPVIDEPQNLAFVQHLGELGLVEGRNLSIERRHGDNRLERLPALAAELAKLKCDVFFAGGSEANLVALKQANRDTPIVFVAVDFDPVATGHVSSLARPGPHHRRDGNSIGAAGQAARAAERTVAGSPQGGGVRERPDGGAARRGAGCGEATGSRAPCHRFQAPAVRL